MIVLIICIVLKILAIAVPLLISVAYFTIVERKIVGIIQRKKVPNVIGFLGLLQLLADGLKLFVKKTIFPSNSNIAIFLIASMLTFILSLIGSCCAGLFDRKLGTYGASCTTVTCLLITFFLSLFAFYEVSLIGCCVYLKFVSEIFLGICVIYLFIHGPFTSVNNKYILCLSTLIIAMFCFLILNNSVEYNNFQIFNNTIILDYLSFSSKA